MVNKIQISTEEDDALAQRHKRVLSTDIEYVSIEDGPKKLPAHLKKPCFLEPHTSDVGFH